MFARSIVAASLLSLMTGQLLGAAEPEAGRRMALLIGCTEYGSLTGRRQLQGPANDVVMLRTMLVNQFRFAPEHIRVLANQAHISRAERAQDVVPAITCEDPTDEHIAAEFERLIGMAQPGDHIFILLSGHGSRQPDLNLDAANDYEPDGLDELFLPCNIGKWESEVAAVEHAITDDRIRDWMAQLVEKGAFVFLVADACHSSTVARGVVDADGRNVGARELGIPEDVLDAARKQAAGQKPDQGPAKPDWFEVAAAADDGSGAVALYAAQPHEEAKEYYPTKPGPKFGRLSHMLHEVLSQCGQQITYRELAQRILWRFEQNNWISESIPEIEGTALDRTVLDLQEWPGRSQLTLHRSERSDSLTAGSLHGITAGSILAVYPPSGQAGDQQLLGYVRVRQVHPLSSVIEPVAWLDIPANDELPDEGRCELVFRERYSELLTLAVESDPPGDGLADRRARTLQELQAVAARSDARFSVVTEGASDWTAVVTQAGVYLQRTGTPVVDWSDAKALEAAQRHGDVFGAQSPPGTPIPLNAQFGNTISVYLRQVAQADALREMAEEAAGTRDPNIDVSVTILRNGAEPSSGEAVPTLKSNDHIDLRITNTGPEPAAVMVFYIDSHFGITQQFPLLANDQPVIPICGELTGQVSFDITDSSTGAEHVIVIAVSAKDKGAFSELEKLEQSSLTATISRGTPSRFQTPLGRLLDTALTGTRGDPQADSVPSPDSFAIRRVTWNIVQEQNPSP
ncbi:MAG: caspase family protein [Planctomycetaceae bacterium]|nr:caspase family protein [Planctomycetaceae bacterium]